MAEDETKQAATRVLPALLLFAGSLLALYLEPEDVSGIFLRNVGKCLLDYTTSHPRRQYSS
jgi:hypothetical protein